MLLTLNKCEVLCSFLLAIRYAHLSKLAWRDEGGREEEKGGGGEKRRRKWIRGNEEWGRGEGKREDILSYQIRILNFSYIILLVQVYSWESTFLMW